MSYDIGLTTLSLVVAMFVTGGGFYVISRQSGSPLRLVLSGGIFMGLGIAAMHYTGMAAMRGHAELSYDPLFVALSLFIAIVASTVALWLAFRTTDVGQKLVAAHAATVGVHLLRRLASIDNPIIREVRGRGLFAGVELHRNMADVGVLVRRLLQVGALTKDTHRDTIRFAPPLIINESQVDWAVDRLTEVLQEAASSSTGAA
jgi:acetylornithine/succinyldiaminopimelate/putrescine aminotransferase